ncbi:MAG: vWA domain-containing protein, partial [Aquaticitalea sp.]
MSYGQTPTFCEDMAGSSCSSCPTFTVTDNPDLGVSCQETIDVILILDESNSIGTANAQNQVRDGVLAFLQELECSPVNVAIIEFGSVANYVVSTYTPTANVRTGMTNYFAGTAYNGQTYNPSQGNLGGTNWQAALLRANALPAADLLLMFTDGQPTTYTPDHTLPGSSYDFCGDGASTQPAETYNAAVLANVIKGKGTHMFVLGVGNAIAGSIPSISGNDVYNSSINSIATSDYEIDANINNIAACFRNLAKSLCPIIVDIDGSSICEDASNGTIDVSLATLATGPFTVTVRQGTTTVQSFITPSKDFTISNLVAGNYNVRVQANGTCYTDGNANTTVSTIVTEPIITNITICSDESYEWPANDITYLGTGGSTSVTIVGQGCDADQILNLTVTQEPTPIITNETICSDESFVWTENGLTYNGADGAVSVTLEGEDCAADRVLNLIVNPEPEVVTTTANICSDEEYTWSVNGVTYTTAQDITIEGEDCAADQRLVLTINPEPEVVTTTASICSDEEYTWSVNGVTYTTAKDITMEGEDCVSDQRLVLTINAEPEVVTTNASICSDEEYTWSVNGVTYSTAQDITIEGEDCAADQRLVLTINEEPAPVVTEVNICSDEEYTWSVNGVTYTTAQDITIEGEDCAADQRLVLTINPEPEVVTTTANICSDEEYTWSVNGVTYTTAQN